jgi:hypothetical protein
MRMKSSEKEEDCVDCRRTDIGRFRSLMNEETTACEQVLEIEEPLPSYQPASPAYSPRTMKDKRIDLLPVYYLV